MDKASDFESEDCEFESRRGRRILGATDKIRDSVRQFHEFLTIIGVN